MGAGKVLGHLMSFQDTTCNFGIRSASCRSLTILKLCSLEKHTRMVPWLNSLER